MTHPDHPDDDTHIVEVYAAANEIEAGAIRAALEEAGIQATLVGDKLGNAFELPIGLSEPKIMVREPDLAAARGIIEQLQQHLGESDAEPGTEPSWADEAEAAGGETA